MINRIEYAWEDIQVVIDGNPQPLLGITAIEYTTTRNHENIHGKGSNPVSIGKGKKDYSGSMTILQSEYQALVAALPPGKSITDIIVGVTVGYAPEVGQPTFDRLSFVRFSESRKGHDTEATHMKVTLPMVIGQVEENV